MHVKRIIDIIIFLTITKIYRKILCQIILILQTYLRVYTIDRKHITNKYSNMPS